MHPVPDAPEEAKPLIGRLPKAIETLGNNEKAIQDRIKAADGKDALQTQSIARVLLAGGHFGTLDRLVDRYTAEINGLLSKNSKFPLVVSDGGPADTSLTADEAKMLGLKMRSVAKDLAAIPPSTWPAAVGTKVDAIPARVAAPSAILEAIQPKGSGAAATVTITLLASPDQKKLMSARLDNDQFAANYAAIVWRTMRVGGNRVRTESITPIDLGKYPLPDRVFTIEFFRGVDDPAPDRTFSFDADWAVMRFIHQSYTHRREGGKEWEVMLPLVDSAGKQRYLFLLLTFDKALPEVNDWPTRASLAPPTS
jgi:hypothetical protein